MARFQPGEVVGDYKVHVFLGAGCGKSYIASRLHDYSQVALKVFWVTARDCLLDYGTLDERFASWLSSFSSAASSVRHPHLASTLGLHLCDDHVMWVREFVEGRTLLERQREGPMTSAAAFFLIGQMLDGLGHLHRHGLAHGDLKPSNVVLGNDGVKLVDFGLTREVRKRWISCTEPAVSYAAPEQLDGSVNEAQSDLYSVGLIAHVLLTGTRPIAACPWDPRKATDTNELVPISQINPAVPSKLSDVVLQAISPMPAHRFQSVDEFHRAWSRCERPAFYLTTETAQRDRRLMRKFRRGNAASLDTLRDSYARLIDGYLHDWELPAPARESCTNRTFAVLMFFGRDNDETAFVELLWRAAHLALCQASPERMAEEIDRLVALESNAAQEVLASADEQGLETADLFERSSKALDILLASEFEPFEKLRSEIAWLSEHWGWENDTRDARSSTMDNEVEPPQDWRAVVSLARRLALQCPDEGISYEGIPNETVSETIAAGDRVMPKLKLRPSIAAIICALLKK